MQPTLLTVEMLVGGVYSGTNGREFERAANKYGNLLFVGRTRRITQDTAFGGMRTPCANKYHKIKTSAIAQVGSVLCAKPFGHRAVKVLNGNLLRLARLPTRKRRSNFANPATLSPGEIPRTSCQNKKDTK